RGRHPAAGAGRGGGRPGGAGRLRPRRGGAGGRHHRRRGDLRPGPGGDRRRRGPLGRDAARPPAAACARAGPARRRHTPDDPPGRPRHRRRAGRRRPDGTRIARPGTGVRLMIFRPLAMTNPIRPYAWGSRTAIAALQGREPSATPEAEMWMGAHPAAPSLLDTPRGRVPLGDLIAADPEGMLGRAALASFGPRLPYLMKVLAADEPLSLQVHPSPVQAEEGYAR